MEGWRIACKGGLFFTPPKQVTSPPCKQVKQGLSVKLTLLQGWRNDWSTGPPIIWTRFESRVEAMWGWSLLMFVSLSVKAGFPRCKLFSEFPSSGRNLRPFPKFNSVETEYFETRVFQWRWQLTCLHLFQEKIVLQILEVKKIEKYDLLFKRLLICFKLGFSNYKESPIFVCTS